MLAERELREWRRNRARPEIAVFASVKSTSPPRSRDLPTPYVPGQFEAFAKRVTLKEEVEGRSPWSSVFDADQRSPNSHSYIDFKPSPVSRGDGNVASPWFSQDFGEREKIPTYHTAEIDHQLTFHQSTVPKQEPCPHSHCISLPEHEEILRQQTFQSQRARNSLLTSLNHQMHQFEQRLQAEYQEKLEIMEKRTSGSEVESRDKGSEGHVSDEVLRRQFEEQLAEESEKEVMQEREIERLRGLLERKREEEGEGSREIEKLERELQGKEREIRALTLEIASKDDFIAELRSKVSSISHLEASIASLTHENQTLRQHSQSSALEEALKLALQELESENSLLRQDYEELLTAHQHTLHDKQMAETVRLKTCSPLKRKIPSSEPNFTPRSQSREMTELRKEYEDKSWELREKATYWQEKTKSFAKHFNSALNALQSESQLLRSDITTLTSQTSQQLQDLSTLLQAYFTKKQH